MSPRAARALGALALLALAAWARRPPPLREGVPVSRAVYDRRGRLLRLTLAADGRYRLWRPLSEISPALVAETLRREDRRFRLHPGVDPFSLANAAWTSYVRRTRRRGGSTVTMQLARLRWGIDSRRPAGKLLQIARALQLELRHSKDEILEAYMNLAPYGGNVEGAEAASLLRFGKDSAALEPAEVRALAAIPRDPSGRARPRAPRPEAPHATRRALALHADERLPSTLDLELQRLLERLIAGYVERRGRAGLRNAAALLVDFTDMSVRAAVGSADPRDGSIQGQVSALTARRSPGSTLKPFVYALAYEQGLAHPRTLLKDAPASFGAFNPENFDGEFAGPIAAGEALSRSRNVPAVELASRLAAPGLHGLLREAGVRLPREPGHYGLGLALGAAELSMEELARLYAMLGNGGELRPLRLHAGEPPAPGRRLLSEESVRLVMSSLKSAPRPREPFRADWRARPTDVYWKTGTSWAFRDAWTAGVFGRYVLVVWVGDFRGRGNPAYVGVEAAAPLFFEIVDALSARETLSDEYARRAPGRASWVQVCALTGGTPGAHCPHRAGTWFIPGVSPIAACEVHRELRVDPASGLRTCRPGEGRVEVFEFWPSDLLRLFRQAGLARRPPPAYLPSCGVAERAGRGLPPRITSPLSGVLYHASATEPGSVALTATADADVRAIWWFVDGTPLGRAPAGQPLFWAPRPGRSVVRAVDDMGRADAREIEVVLAD